jgi:hypothetical protein
MTTNDVKQMTISSGIKLFLAVRTCPNAFVYKKPGSLQLALALELRKWLCR